MQQQVLWTQSTTLGCKTLAIESYLPWGTCIMTNLKYLAIFSWLVCIIYVIYIYIYIIYINNYIYIYIIPYPTFVATDSVVLNSLQISRDFPLGPLGSNRICGWPRLRSATMGLSMIKMGGSWQLSLQTDGWLKFSLKYLKSKWWMVDKFDNFIFSLRFPSKWWLTTSFFRFNGCMAIDWKGIPRFSGATSEAYWDGRFKAVWKPLANTYDGGFISPE